MSTDEKTVNPADTSANSPYTVREVSRNIVSRLTPRFGSGEANAMNRIIWEDLKGYTPTQLIINGDLHVSEYMLAKIKAVVDKVAGGEPLQYLLGDARFYGMRFKVNPSVLIPRPETAGLVDIIVDNNSRPDLRVLDIGTGSGCIAIALSRNLPFARVTALDISEKALAVAAENAADLHARIDFVRGDILTMKAPVSPCYDIIVSNPPYVMETERVSMDAYVAGHEPSLALFVPDDDPLRFYHAICRYAMGALVDNGQLYFELNPLTANTLAAYMKADGWISVTLSKDDQKMTRYLSAIRPAR